MAKILAFDKIITQISILKNDLLGLDKLVIYAENLDKIFQNENQPNLELKLFLSSHDFLVLELSHFWLQNQYTLGTNSPLREKKIWIKWQNLLESLQKLITKLKEINQNETKSNMDIKNLLVTKIIKIYQNLEQKLEENSENQSQNPNKNSLPKLTFVYKKNLIDISLGKNNWSLKTHFDQLITANIKEKSNLVIQTSLEKDDFETLQKICGLKILNLEIVYAKPSQKVAKIGQKLFVKNWKNLEKSEIEDNFVSSLNLEIFLEQKLNEINNKINFYKETLREKIDNEIDQSKLENCDQNQIINQITNIDSQNEQESKNIIVIICGQNSGLRDCSQVIFSHSKFAKKFLILGESGSLTKIASKIETFSGFLIVKMSDFFRLLEISNLRNKTCEVWIINQPYFRTDNFWSPVNCEKLKELNLQSQINFLEKICNCPIYFVKTY